MASALSGPRKVSYALILLVLAVAARFNLGHALIAGLFAHMLLTKTEEALADAGASAPVARWSSVAIFVVLGALLAMIFVTFVQLGVARLPLLLDRVLPRLDALSNRFGVDLPVDNVHELRALILSSMKENARSVSATSGLLTRGFFQILVAVLVAILHFASPEPAPSTKRGLDVELARECAARAGLFSRSFDRVMGAQILVAAINAGVAGVFMFILRIPFRTVLTLTTFVCGLFPIVGNLISNSLIVASALTVSGHMAAAALVFLIIAHKGGYLLYGRIVGARIEIPTWAILAGLLIGEALLGVTGVILAPTLIYYIREELRAA
jgi:predicted PurR-regulated permease PerM